MVTKRKGITLTVIGLVLVISVVVGGFVHTMTTPRIMSDSELKINGAYLFDKPRAFDAIRFTDHNSQPFTQQRFEDKWSLVFFWFYLLPGCLPNHLVIVKPVLPTIAGRGICR